jgi:oligopeptide/dipeptide ABC transporter ATP-binding protein
LSLLEVEDLRVTFATDDGLVRAVQGVSFSIDPGQTLGIVGESGSGKSVSTQTIMGLTRGAKIEGRALLEGRDLLTMTPDELRKVRGNKIAMIFQDPLSSLHPHYRVGWQIIEMIRNHESDRSKAEARDRAIELLRLVGIPQPDKRVDDYPHQFSGGMRQRAMIAMALALNPSIIIADEPTTALDVTVQAQILDLIERIQEEFGSAVIMITHDLGVVADMADQVLVMYAGKPVEMADRRTTYYKPHHPYTKGLLESMPSSASSRLSDRLKPIKGAPPSLINLPSGCSFHPRCPYVMDVCVDVVPPLHAVAGGVGDHYSACHLPADEIGITPEVDAARVATAKSKRTQDANTLNARGSGAPSKKAASAAKTPKQASPAGEAQKAAKKATPGRARKAGS